MSGLRRSQTWFMTAVTSPALDPSFRRDASRVLTSGPRMSAEERLDVYRHAYTARLVECLADDYPALQSAIGGDAFERLCRAYIARHPSTSPNLNGYGRHMADLCARHDVFDAGAAPEAPPGFMSGLAALEWAIVEVIHAPSAPPLTLARLAEVPVDRWAEARLSITPAFRSIRSDYPVNPYFHAFRQGGAPKLPAAARSAAAVYRSGATIWRMDLTDVMFDLLREMAAGATLGASLEHAAAAFSDESEDVAAARVMGWFREWVSSGVFSAVELG